MMCNYRADRGVTSKGKRRLGVQCKHEATERWLSTWYCRAHCPKADAVSHCSHSLGITQCAFCGTLFDE